MPSNVTTLHPETGSGYQMENGRRASAERVTLIALAALAEGQTIGSVVEVGAKGVARLTLETTVKSGTSPTLDVAVETSPDGLTAWRKIAAFDQQSDVGLAMSAVTSSGTTPPAVTLTGTPNRYINLKVLCTTLGARGTSAIKYSLDGGETYSAPALTAATQELFDPVTGETTGVTLAMANAAAAVDNVWTAKTAGYERKQFAGLDRFMRAAIVVGGSSTPIMTASLTGELV